MEGGRDVFRFESTTEKSGRDAKINVWKYYDYCDTDTDIDILKE